MADATDVYSPHEIGRIIQFCNKMGLDYGELDIIRDDEEGRIFIVDCNNTPGGPTKLTAGEMFSALHKLSRGFQHAFLEEYGKALQPGY